MLLMINIRIKSLIIFIFRYKQRMQAMLYEDDEVYSQISSDHQSRDNSALNMSITSPGA